MHISPQFAKTLITPPKTNEDLRWYYQDSESALGMGSAGHEPQYKSNIPIQAWPSKAMVAASHRQRAIRAALRQLGSRLQSVLECAYGLSPHATPLISSFGVAAGVIARLLNHSPSPTNEDYTMVLLLLHAAHDAFELAYRPARKLRSRKGRAEAWLAENGL